MSLAAKGQMPRYVDIVCFGCFDAIPLVAEDAEGFYCRACDRRYGFLLCTSCESVIQVVATGGLRRITCDWCGCVVGKDKASAADRQAELDERGLGRPSPDDVVVGGFRLIGGSGFALETATICSVLSLPEAVDVRAEGGGVGIATIPYAELTALDIGDKTTTRGGGFLGGGLGLPGAVEGMLVASLLNRIPRRTSIDTGLAIASVHGELLLGHDRLSGDELRRVLFPVFTRFNAARNEQAGAGRHDPAAQLERLMELRDKAL